MSNYAVIKGASYTLAHAPDMLLQGGTTQTTERLLNPDSEYLKTLPEKLRSYEDVLSYLPNQVYIGNKKPDDLTEQEFPWFDKKVEGKRDGRFGEIIPQDEFVGLMQICDTFDLIKLEEKFSKEIQGKLSEHDLIGEEKAEILGKNDSTADEIKKLVTGEGAEPLYNNGILVGAVKKAHDVDVNLSARVMTENLVSKASSVLSLMHLIKTTGVHPGRIDYVIDCCEEACGDMNQRGGGNFAKAAAEIAGLSGATGSDARSFCAGPAHAIIYAASLVKAGTFKSVVVTAGGSLAKLGMNGKDHLKKNIPVLEDCIAGFSVLITENDGKNPRIRNDIVGKHTVGTGSSPQAVMESLVTNALESAGLKITDIDKFAPEMQNPDITKPAGAGDVPEANYKMIGALGVKRGELEKKDLLDFVKKHGLPGWAPTQGHIPSGVPYLGFAREDILEGRIEKAMIIGKGSLFLGRMTNLFDGISFILDKNDEKTESESEKTDKPDKTESESEKTDKPDKTESGNKPFIKAEPAPLETKKTEPGNKPLIGIASEGSEFGEDNIREAVEIAEKKGLKAVIIKGKDVHEKMEDMLDSGEIAGAVTMHYAFPIGVSTVGKVITPAKDRPVYIATTTGTSDTVRVSAMVKNAVLGIIAAKSDGIKEPTIGILNIDGARACEKALRRLDENGYKINFSESVRTDGGVVMRGNDLLQGSADIMVMDSLTGNLLVKTFSSYTTGGLCETSGWGYGPGIGKGYDKTISIVSRASGAPLIVGAIEYTTKVQQNDISSISMREFEDAEKAGLGNIISDLSKLKETVDTEKINKPDKEVVVEEITGIEVMDIEDAAMSLWKEGIYAESGMGCSGPVVLVSSGNLETAKKILKSCGYL